jgi:hypothetical protein
MADYMTVEAMENYVPKIVYELAEARLNELANVVNALPDYSQYPSISEITVYNETADGDFYLTFSASDPLERELSFKMKTGSGEFEKIWPLTNEDGTYSLKGYTAPRGNNPCYITVSNGVNQIISDVFNIIIPIDPSAIYPTIEKIDNIKADVDEVISIRYIAYDTSGTIIKHEYSDEGGTYDITEDVIQIGSNYYIYKISYNNITNINNAYITVYSSTGLRTKSNLFSITVQREAEATSLVEFDIVPLKYKTNVDTIEIEYTCSEPLENVKLSLNGGDFFSANLFNQNKAVFSVKGVGNGTYTAKLRGYFREDVR